MESRKQPEEATVHERPSGEPLVPEEYEQGIDSNCWNDVTTAYRQYRKDNIQ